MGHIKGAGSGGETGRSRTRIACHIGISAGVHGNTPSFLCAASSQEGGIVQCGAGGIELAHKYIGAAVMRLIVSTGGNGKVNPRVSSPNNISGTVGVHCDAIGSITARSPQEGGIVQCRAGRIELTHKRIYAAAVVGHIKGPGSGGKIGYAVIGIACNISIPVDIHRNPPTLIIARSPQEGGIEQCATGGIEQAHESVGIAVMGYIKCACRGREITGHGRTGNVGIAIAIYRKGICTIIAGSAQEGGIEQAAAICAKFAHKNVSAAVVGSAKGTGCGREVCGGILSRPGDIGVAVGVGCNAVAVIRSASAQESGIAQNRIDDQRPGVVVTGHCKSQVVAVCQAIGAVYRFALAIIFLVDEWCLQQQFATSEMQNGIAALIKGDGCVAFLRRQSVKLHLDLIRVSAGRNYKIIFQVLLVAVVHQVNALINCFVVHFLVIDHIRAPLRGVTAAKVIGLRYHLRLAGNRRVGIGIGQFHAYHSAGVLRRRSAGGFG